MTAPRFIGDLELGIDPADPKSMLVAKEFSFEDSTGLFWYAHVGDVTNGASIPRQFKIIVGGSYQTPYLIASVLHDIYCSNKSRTWQATDKMFLEALRTNGVSKIKSYSMFLAVWFFGPHW